MLALEEKLDSTVHEPSMHKREGMPPVWLGCSHSDNSHGLERACCATLEAKRDKWGKLALYRDGSPGRQGKLLANLDNKDGLGTKQSAWALRCMAWVPSPLI